MRALTAVCVRLRLTAALTKLPVLTTSRNVRATLISIDQYLSGKAAIIFICLLTITGRSFLGKTESDRKSVVSGKGVSVSVDLGGSRILKKKNKKTKNKK